MHSRLPLIVLVVALWGLAAPTAASADYSSEVIAGGPLAYYRLNETSGLVAVDSSGSLLAGAYSPTNVAYGAAGPFAGTGSGTSIRLTTAGGVSSTVPGTAHTAEFWVKPSSRTPQTLVEHGDPAGDG